MTAPARLYITPQGIWERLFHASARELEHPRRDDWPANLFYVAGQFFDRPEWTAWGQPPPYGGVHLFRRGLD